MERFEYFALESMKLVELFGLVEFLGFPRVVLLFEIDSGYYFTVLDLIV